MFVSVVQPPYHAGEHPDGEIATFLTDALDKAKEHSLIVLPEYSNAGGLSDKESELAALPRAKEMLQKASAVAKQKSAFVAINVLEEREGNLWNSTYLFGKDGEVAFIYNKVHLPPSEIHLGVTRGDGACVCEVDGIRFAFMTCYDIYFNEQIEYIAAHKPDIIILPTYQRGEKSDIIEAQAKLLAYRCNAFVARSSFSMGSNTHGGNSMIVSPDGTVLENIGAAVGSIGTEIDPKWKYTRAAGFGSGTVRADDFVNDGLCPEIFQGE